MVCRVALACTVLSLAVEGRVAAQPSAQGPGRGGSQAQVAAGDLYMPRNVRRAYALDLPIITPFDALKHGGYGFANNAYIKPALAYLSLRDLLGEDVFRQTLHEFVRRWNGRRPSPWDMFNTFCHASGTDLRWFFARWFFEPTYIDIAIETVTAEAGTHAVGVRNAGGAPIPFDVEVVFGDGSTKRFPQGAGTWRDAPVATVRVATPAPVKTIRLNSGIFADFIAQNNTWDRR